MRCITNNLNIFLKYHSYQDSFFGYLLSTVITKSNVKKIKSNFINYYYPLAIQHAAKKYGSIFFFIPTLLLTSNLLIIV